MDSGEMPDCFSELTLYGLIRIGQLGVILLALQFNEILQIQLRLYSYSHSHLCAYHSWAPNTG